jgi:UDP-glucose:(heptosyl)LPS alpha-1,3-glucosyltransferase
VDRRHGTERALAELLERLVRGQHCEIHLYAQSVEDLALAGSSTVGPQNSGRIVWHRVPSIPGPHLLQFLVWLFLNSLCRAWDRWVHGLQFDLVLSPGVNCLNADVIIVHALFQRLQELSREKVAESGSLSFFRQFHRRAYYALLTVLERHLYSDPKVALAAVSHRTAGLLSNYFHRQDVRVVPNGVDAAQFSPAARLARRADVRRSRGLGENDFVLLLIGNDWRVKGLPAVLRAMGTLGGASLHLIVVGDEAQESFRESARQLGILERCHFEPPCREVLDLYAAADLYVSPSLEDSFGLPVAEAMACGLPVITSPFAGVSELIQNGENGFVLKDPQDPQELVRLIQHCIQDGELRNRIGAAAAKLAAGWTWERNACTVREILQSVYAKK